MAKKRPRQTGDGRTAEPFCPFGYPEGSKIDYRVIAQEFVRFQDDLVWGDLATRDDDLRSRVLAGRRGSGKTVYLRRLEDHCSKATDLIAIPRETAPPTSDLVLHFRKRCGGMAILEQWRLIWRRSIFRSVGSRILAEARLRPRLSQRSIDAIVRLCQEATGRRLPLAEGVYSALSSILYSKQTTQDFQAYLRAPFWDELEQVVADAIADAPPVCLFLDGVDGNFESAPRYWIECQLGLVHAVLDLLDETPVSSRLHVFITVRESVYLKLLEGSQGFRLAAPPYVRRLAWDSRAARYLLEEKIGRLPESVLMGRSASTPFARWLGTETVRIQSRSSDENAVSYLLRHTRLLPRDLIRLGNEVAFHLYRATWFEDIELPHSPIVDGVHALASLIGEELLKECALNLVGDTWPAGAVEPKDPAGIEAGIHSLRARLRDFLRQQAGTEILSRRRLETLRRAAEDAFPGSDVLGALWLSGLLGIVDGEGKKSAKAVFSFSLAAAATELPTKAKYIFHSSLIEAVGLRSSNQQAVPIT
ncbi:MAG: hypothetical protein QG573_1894 [Acidobacteriota bacterium]|nr:hypothetical protein [Acidobacteriota bacterium]